MEPSFHFLLRAGGGVSELLVNHRDRLLELPKPFGAVAWIDEGGAHQLGLGHEIGGGCAAGEAERIIAYDQG